MPVRQWRQLGLHSVDLGMGKAHRAFARNIGSPDCRRRGGRLARCDREAASSPHPCLRQAALLQAARGASQTATSYFELDGAFTSSLGTIVNLKPQAAVIFSAVSSKGRSSPHSYRYSVWRLTPV